MKNPVASQQRLQQRSKLGLRCLEQAVPEAILQIVQQFINIRRSWLPLVPR